MRADCLPSSYYSKEKERQCVFSVLKDKLAIQKLSFIAVANQFTSSHGTSVDKVFSVVILSISFVCIIV